MLVVGSINTDLVVRGSRLPLPGETVIGGEFARFYGGKGANQAVAAARLATGVVTFVGCVGEDGFGQDSLQHLQAEQLDCRYVKRVTDCASGVALILVDAQGENSISVASGANLKLLPADIDAIPSSVFAKADVLLGSLEVPVETVLRSVERAKKEGAITIVNPAPANPALLAGGLSGIDILTPNEVELAQLSQSEVRDDESVVKAARRLIQWGCQTVIVTLGPRGAFVVTVDDAQWVPVDPVQAVDTTAAGDAFNGALAVSLSEGSSLLDAVRWSNRAASIAVTRAGAQASLPRRDELP